MFKKENIVIGAVLLIGLIVVSGLMILGKKPQIRSGDNHGHGHGSEAEGHAHDHSASQGPHGGKILTEGEFELEVVIYEKGVPAHFRIYPSFNHKAVDPREVNVTVELERLGDKTETLSFRPTGEFLYSQQEINEPHSFFIKINAEYGGEKYGWEYSQYENRITVANDLAEKMASKLRLPVRQNNFGTRIAGRNYSERRYGVPHHPTSCRSSLRSQEKPRGFCSQRRSTGRHRQP